MLLLWFLYLVVFVRRLAVALVVWYMSCVLLWLLCVGGLGGLIGYGLVSLRVVACLICCSLLV